MDFNLSVKVKCPPGMTPGAQLGPVAEAERPPPKKEEDDEPTEAADTGPVRMPPGLQPPNNRPPGAPPMRPMRPIDTHFPGRPESTRMLGVPGSVGGRPMPSRVPPPGDLQNRRRSPTPRLTPPSAGQNRPLTPLAPGLQRPPRPTPRRVPTPKSPETH